MTPTQWVEERAKEWAEWVEKVQAGANGYRISSLLADEVGSGSAYGPDHDFTFFNHQRCNAFDAAVGALSAPLRVVFRMHWLGSEAKQVSHATSVAIKAGLCGVSRATYYRRIDEANQALYDELH